MRRITLLFVTLAIAAGIVAWLAPSSLGQGETGMTAGSPTADNKGTKQVIVTTIPSGYRDWKFVSAAHEAEVIRRRGPWRSLEDVEFATLTWVAWYNTSRLMEPLGHVPPAEYEQMFYARQEPSAEMAALT